MRCGACITSPTTRRPSPSPDVHSDEGPLPLDLYALGRGLAYLAMLTLIGVCVFIALIPRWRLPEDDDRSLAARALAGAWNIAAAAAALLLIAHLLRAYGQVRSFLDPAEAFSWSAARPMLFQTTWGKGWVAQLGVATVTLPLVLLARLRPVTGLALLGTATLAVAATTPLTGHAAEHPWGRQLGVGVHAAAPPRGRRLAGNPVRHVAGGPDSRPFRPDAPIRGTRGAPRGCPYGGRLLSPGPHRRRSGRLGGQPACLRLCWRPPKPAGNPVWHHTAREDCRCCS